MARAANRLWRLAGWVLSAGFLFFAQLVWLFLLRGTYLFHRDGILIGGQILLAAAILAIAILLRTTPRDAIRVSRRTSHWIIIAGVAALHSAAILLLLPGLSADVVRYRIDGRMWLSGKSPYAIAPMDFAGADAIDALVPNREMRTIYRGAAEGAFALSARIDRLAANPPPGVGPMKPGEDSTWRAYLQSSPHPWRALALRAIFALALLLAVMVLLRLLQIRDRAAWWAVILGWNPLATLEIGGMGHVDALGILLLLLALLALAKRKTATAGGWLALATAVKPFAILLLPFAMRPHRFRLLIVFTFIAILALVAPLLIQHGYAGWRQTAQIYAHSREANGSTYNWITRSFGHGDESRAMARARKMAWLLSVAGMLACAIAVWRAGASTAMAGYILGLAALIFSPVVYPWYLLWALCFVPILDGRAGWSAIVWSGTASVSYLLWRSTDWQLSRAALMAEYLPVYAAIAIEMGCMWIRPCAKIQRSSSKRQPTGTAEI